MNDPERVPEFLAEEVQRLRVLLTQKEQAEVESRRREQDRQDEARLYRLLFERNPDPAWVFDNETYAFLAVNEATVRHYGFARDEVLAATVERILPADEWQRFRQSWPPFPEPKASGDDAEVCPCGTWKHRRADGSLFDAEVLASHLSFRGRPACLVLVRDVTERLAAEAALRESEERHRLLSALTSDYTYACRVEPDGRIVIETATEGMASVTGYSPEEAEAQGGWAALIHPDDLEEARRSAAQSMSGQQTWVDLRLRKRSGETRWVRVFTRPLYDEAQGRVVRLLGAVQDVTERRQAEQALREREARLRILVEEVPAILWTVDTNLVFTSSVGAALSRLNLRPNEIVGQTIMEYTGSHDPDFLPIASHRQALQGYPQSYEMSWRGGTFQIHLEPLRGPDGTITGCIGVALDVTDRKKSERQLAEYTRQLQELSRRLLVVQEEERSRLALVLHEQIGQDLAGLQFGLEMLARHLPEDLRLALAETLAQIRELTGRVRDLSLELRPTMLDDLGLLPALVWQIKRSSAHLRAPIDFEHRGLDRRFTPAVETTAYRIVQEALAGLALEQEPDWIAVHVWVNDELLCVRVVSPWSGFATDPVHATALSAMQERAALLGGRLSLEPRIGKGACLIAELPVILTEAGQV